MEKYRAEGTFRPDNEQGDHIYEYLLKKRLPPSGGSSHGGTNRNETGRIKTNHRLPPSLPLPPPPPTSSGEDEIHELAPSLGKIRNSLSTSPSTEEDSSTNNTAERNQYQGKENSFKFLSSQKRIHLGLGKWFRDYVQLTKIVPNFWPNSS